MPDDRLAQIAAAFVQAIPQNLGDVIRENRDFACLRMAADDDIARLVRVIPATNALTGSISDWRLVEFSTDYAGQSVASIHVLGNNARRGVGCKITSPVLAIDFGTGLAATRSGSIYQLIGAPGAGEPPRDHLLMLCAALWSWGYGMVLGVPHIYY